MNFHVLTLFPDMVKQGLSESILGRAEKNGYLTVQAVNIRDYTLDKHGKVDDYPYGGGAGLLMQAQPVFDAHKACMEKIGKEKVRTIYLSPRGKTFNQRMAEELAEEEDLIFLCGHYEGIDERVLEEIVTDTVSIGDFVLTGGELPAMMMIDAIARLIPGVLHNDFSAVDESFSGYLLEYPQYTRPEEWHGKTVPKELLSGNHKVIRKWRKEKAEENTKNVRPDLYEKYEELMQVKEELIRKNKLLHKDMTELIDRGNAVLIERTGEAVLLQNRKTGTFYLTCDRAEAGQEMLAAIESWEQKNAKQTGCPQRIILHQDIPLSKEDYQKAGPYDLYVYTRKEITDAGKTRGKQESEMVLESPEGDFMYKPGMFDPDAGTVDEVKEREEELMAAHKDYLHESLKRGIVPYTYVPVQDLDLHRILESLNLYKAKGSIWKLERL
ncbi:MAG: tRNA (guanosine(37)-N1)-methyltransferase TrmD [Lachnospiraceae bacterium]